MDYQRKYLDIKNKYIQLKNQIGGTRENILRFLFLDTLSDNNTFIVGNDNNYILYKL